MTTPLWSGPVLAAARWRIPRVPATPARAHAQMLSSHQRPGD